MSHAPPSRRLLRSRPAWALALVAVLGMGAAFWLALPYGLWAYNVQRAGTLLEQGLAWPEPRRADALPRLADDAAVEGALGHLGAALRWRPRDSHARRLAAHAYIAQGKLPLAAETLQEARALSPRAPMLAWEQGLIYERLALSEEPPVPAAEITAQLLQGRAFVAGRAIAAPNCVDGATRRCLVGATPPPEAAPTSDEPPATLFLQAPASLSSALRLPQTPSALSFEIGRLPADDRGAGAQLQLWVEPTDALPELLFEAVPPAAGWQTGWADLSPWAGRVVTLRFAATGAGGAWLGWGKVALTTPERAQESWASSAMIQSWLAGGFDGNVLLMRAEEARKEGNIQAAAEWYRRAFTVGAWPASGYLYVQALAYQERGAGPQATQALAQAVRTDLAWLKPLDRFFAWGWWGDLAAERGDLVEAERAWRIAVVAYPGRDGAPTYSELLRRIADQEAARGEVESALEHYRSAVQANEQNWLARVGLGKMLYQQNPARRDDAQQHFLAALTAQPGESELWRELITFWQAAAESDAEATLCQRARQASQRQVVAALCP